MKRAALVLLAIFLTLPVFSQTPKVGGVATLGGVANTGGTTQAGSSISMDSGSPVHTTAGTGATNAVNLTIGSGCANPVLTVTVSVYDAGTPNDVTAITYNSVSMLSNVIYDVAPQSSQRVAAFYLINPTHDGAAHSLSYTLAGAVSGGSHASAIAWCNANQSTPIRQSNTASTASGGTTQNVALSGSVSGDVYMLSGVFDTGGVTGSCADSSTVILSDTTTGTISCYKTGLTGASTPSFTTNTGATLTGGAFAVRN